MSMPRLLLDAGNTRLKWAVVVDGTWQTHGAADYTALPEAVPLPMHAYVASVTHPENEERLRAWCGKLGIPVRWLGVEAAFGDLRNRYDHPEQLGVDRWMALIAIRQRTRGAALIVSAGTAVTIDALAADGDFLGGMIVPGCALMRTALKQGTARIEDIDGEVRDFPRKTADAVESGILAALAGAVRTQYARLGACASVRPRCFLTGGDAAYLLPHLAIAAEHVPNLVLEGIDCVAGKEAA
ncbi:MAG: type III pantothenate kinase [Pseudomonadota bacterium]